MLSFKVLVLCVLVVGMMSGGAAKAANPVIEIETSLGKIKVELFEDKAPITVKNFMDYVEAKHYDGLTFHRVIEKFMVQGGGMEPNGTQRKTKDPIKNESTNGLSNLRGTIAMARTGVPDSATSQFFINTVDNEFLDKAKSRDGVGYCVFGRVIEGMDVVDKIKGVKTAQDDKPVEDVLIKSVKKVEAKK